MRKVNLFLLAIIFALSLIILPFSAMAAETADDDSLEKVTRSIAVEKCKGTLDEDEFSKFINYVKYAEPGETYCYDCKKGIVLQGQRAKCHVRIQKNGQGSYIVK
jgi:hypothetical protein